MFSKLERSQKAHKRLKDYYWNIGRSKSHTPKSFYAIVKNRYHEYVYNWQKNHNKLLSNKEKKSFYSSCISEVVDDRKYENKYGVGGYYIPKKYRDD